MSAAVSLLLVFLLAIQGTAPLRKTVADSRIFRVVRVAQDSISGTVALKPDQPGTTSLAVIANGMRQYLTVTVPPRAAPGKVDCP